MQCESLDCTEVVFVNRNSRKVKTLGKANVIEKLEIVVENYSCYWHESKLIFLERSSEL